jgi:hypothetical protein
MLPCQQGQEQPVISTVKYYNRQADGIEINAIYQ